MTSSEHTPSLTSCEVADCRFPCGFGRSGLSLAIDRNSLARYSKRTHGSCVHDLSVASFLGDHMRLIISWFQALFTSLPRVFFSVRSRYYCTIGLGTYLGSEDCTSQLPARYPTHGPQDTFNHASSIRLRDYHPLRSVVPGTFNSGSQRVPKVHYSTSPCPRRAGIRFVLGPFRSPLLRASRLISFPSPTRMLYFGEFPFLAECPLRDRSSDSVIGGSQVPCAYPPLIAAWHDLPRRPSPAIPQLTVVSYTNGA